MPRQGSLYSGRRVNSLVLLEKDTTQHRKWWCQCDCGNKKSISETNLVREHTKSCGCLRSKISKESVKVMIESNRANGSPATTHGKRYESAWTTWSHMLDRCNNPNCSQYSHYGGRGIQVCERWLKFENFYADMGDRPENLSLERTDNSKGYSPDNCKWATKKQQARNTRTNQVLDWQGESLCIAEWAERLNLNAKTLYTRLYAGWDTERILTTPTRP